MMEGARIAATVDRCSMADFTEQVQRLLANELGRDLFTIPAFEMLLDLYTCRCRQPRSLTALTAASSASERNSQRIVHRMAERGLVKLRRDPTDGRRIIVELEPETRILLNRFFDRMVELVTVEPAPKQAGR
ncbi:MarR family winged helix-turn-helix transcriptional regulator [Sphingopyxis indica]|nr:MarR family winged helix-turn-helix transcriptional regulator [Sphingopyxis indica]